MATVLTEPIPYLGKDAFGFNVLVGAGHCFAWQGIHSPGFTDLGVRCAGNLQLSLVCFYASQPFYGQIDIDNVKCDIGGIDAYNTA